MSDDVLATFNLFEPSVSSPALEDAQAPEGDEPAPTFDDPTQLLDVDAPSTPLTQSRKRDYSAILVDDVDAPPHPSMTDEQLAKRKRKGKQQIPLDEEDEEQPAQALRINEDDDDDDEKEDEGDAQDDKNHPSDGMDEVAAADDDMAEEYDDTVDTNGLLKKEDEQDALKMIVKFVGPQILALQQVVKVFSGCDTLTCKFGFKNKRRVLTVTATDASKIVNLFSMLECTHDVDFATTETQLPSFIVNSVDMFEVLQMRGEAVVLKMAYLSGKGSDLVRCAFYDSESDHNATVNATINLVDSEASMEYDNVKLVGLARHIEVVAGDIARLVRPGTECIAFDVMKLPAGTVEANANATWLRLAATASTGLRSITRNFESVTDFTADTPLPLPKTIVTKEDIDKRGVVEYPVCTFNAKYLSFLLNKVPNTTNIAIGLRTGNPLVLTILLDSEAQDPNNNIDIVHPRNYVRMFFAPTGTADT